MPDQQPYRLLRAGMFTLVCASVSAHAHHSSSGDEVPWSGLLLGMVLVFGTAWAASHRRQSRAALTAWMLWGQLALHVTYGSAPAFGTGHGHHLPAEAVAASPTWMMLTAHLLVAVLSAWWLGVGEERFFAFLCFMALVALTVLLIRAEGSLRYLARGTPPPETEQGERPRAAYLSYVRLVRGPPPRLSV